MSDDALGLTAVYATAFGLNAAPGLMPPTAIVVALIVVQLELPVLPAAVGAVLAAGLGRLMIARYAVFFRRWLHRKADDLDALRHTLEARPHALGLTSFLYSIALPTNLLFAAAGLAGASLRWVLAGYYMARLPIDGVLIWTAQSITRDVFVDAYRSPLGIALQVAGIGLFVLTLRLPWARWLTTVPSSEPDSGPTDGDAPLRPPH